MVEAARHLYVTGPYGECCAGEDSIGRDGEREREFRVDEGGKSGISCLNGTVSSAGRMR